MIDILRKNLIWIVGLSLTLVLNAFAEAADPDIVSAQWPDLAQYPVCTRVDAFNCAATCTGGDSRFQFRTGTYTHPDRPPHGKSYYGWSTGGSSSVEYTCYSYPDKPICPAGYIWDGAESCKKETPCTSKAGMDVDDGTLDFGDGANKRLSMVFTAKSSDDYVGNTFCSGGCQASITKEVGGGGVTINGKYAGTFNAKFSGSACNTGQQNVNKTTDPGLLPKDSDEKKCVDKGMGFGYVNVKVMCVPADKTNSTEKKTGETTKPDGSRTTESKTDKTICSGGVCTTTTTTITTEYNSSGTATGTTTKTETTSKPDPNAAVSGNGSGGGGEGAECGIPGKPPCSVKVDETGTPSDISGINSNKTALETAMDQIKEKFGEVSQPKQWSVVWNYQLPSGACSPLQFGGQRFSTSLDICKPLGYVRDLWSYVISFLTGLYIWRSCRDALNLT